MTCLEKAYYWSQIVLTVIAGLAAIGAYIQLQTFKRFELLKILEDPEVRKARRLIYLKFHINTSKPPANWWEYDDDLEEAASTVCAAFDIVGLIAKGKNRKFFLDEWSHPIRWTYEILESYIDARNPSGYHGYRSLYRDVKKVGTPEVQVAP